MQNIGQDVCCWLWFQVKRRLIVASIVDSEKSYAASLRSIVEVGWMTQIQARHSLTEAWPVVEQCTLQIVQFSEYNSAFPSRLWCDT